MTTRSPRMSITLPTQVRDIIERIAVHSRTPAARLVAEVLTEASPVLERMAAAMEQVAQMNAQKSAAIRATLAEAEAEAEKTAATALALLDRIGAPDVGAKHARQAGGPVPKRHRRQASPPSS